MRLLIIFMGKVTREQLSFADYSKLIGCLLVLLIESATLVRVIWGSRNKLIIKILAILIGANLANCVNEITYINGLNHGFTYIQADIVYGSEAVGYLLFNVGHWIFANKYFSLSRQAPHKLAQKEVPRSTVLCDKIINCFFLSLNVLPPILLGVGFIGFY